MRAEKKSVVEELESRLTESPYVLLTDYSGMTVTQFGELRKRLRDCGARYRVVKNTMVRRGLASVGREVSNDGLVGMTAMVFATEESEISAAAKVIKNFDQEFEKPKIKFGFFGEDFLSAEDLIVLADLPPMEVLRSQLIGLLQTPATRVATVLGAPASQIARVLKAYAEKNEGASEVAASG